MKVSDYDVYIVQFGTVYLVAMPYEDTKVCRLSDSPYDAMPFRHPEDAQRIARLADGTAIMFNPVTGKRSDKW